MRAPIEATPALHHNLVQTLRSHVNYSRGDLEQAADLLDQYRLALLDIGAVAGEGDAALYRRVVWIALHRGLGMGQHLQQTGTA